MSEPKSRNEIPEKYKWKLEDMFPCDDAWESAAKSVVCDAESFCAYSGRLGESGKTLLAALREIDAIGDALLSVCAYACMRRDEDNENAKYRACADRAGDIESKCAESLSFFEPELIDVGREKIEEFMRQTPELCEYKQFFDDTFRLAEHTLDKKSEQLLAMSSPMGESAHDIFAALNNADIDFGTVHAENGEEQKLTHSRYGVFVESENRSVRKEAYEKLYAQYKKYKNTFAASYAGSVKSDLFYAKARGYKDTLSMSLAASNVPQTVYDRLIEDVNEGISELSSYIGLRKKALGIKELSMYDLYVPIVSEDDGEISFEEACETVLEAVKPLGAQYVNDMKKAFSERWIDVYENRGKTSGAYSWGDNKTHPYVLTNYQGKLEDVFTLAHEMGHAMHSFYTNKTQPSVYRDYKIFVAEVASTVNENLLLEHLLKNAKGVRRAYLLGRKLEAIRTTFYRQTMFAEFEKKAHSAYQNGTPLTSEALCEIYGALNKKYYPGVLCDENISYEWARIPHFYTSFYVYQYATGYAAATRIKELVLGDKSAAERYISFLKSGSSAYPTELLRRAGADLEKGEAAKNVISDMKAATGELLSLI